MSVIFFVVELFMYYLSSAIFFVLKPSTHPHQQLFTILAYLLFYFIVEIKLSDRIMP